jgi:hypothetical protein
MSGSLCGTDQEFDMNRVGSLVIAVGFVVLSGEAVPAQEMARYRIYVLESSLDSVVAASGSRAEVKTLHERPAKIQELLWQAPYASSRATLADPVREIAFTFYNDALYQVVVNYDRDRTEGLTNKDIIESISATYGVPTPASARTRANPPAAAFPDSIVLARWETAESVLTLVRGANAPEFQLILTGTALSVLARSASREAIRLDALEAPRREAEQRKKEASDASTVRDKTRTTNRAAFRP